MKPKERRLILGHLIWKTNLIQNFIIAITKFIPVENFELQG